MTAPIAHCLCNCSISRCRPFGALRRRRAVLMKSISTAEKLACSESMRPRIWRDQAAVTSDRPFVGRSVPRLEDRPLVMGNGRFAADISFAHQLHMRVARSAHAHGRILSIETRAAREATGVVAIWTSADVADIPPIDFRLTRIEGLDPYRQPILATERVRYVGEPVAVVFATDPYSAEDAADLVAVEVEPLPELLDADAPPGEFDATHSTEVTCVRKGFGDVDK